MLASFGRLKIRGKLWTVGSLMMPVTLFAFACSRWLPLSLVILVFIGWAFMLVVNNSNALVQSYVPDELRGRVMGVYSLVFLGSMPLGALLAGSLAERLNEPLTVMLSSSLLLIFALATWFFLPDIRKQE
jgi:predicted MFS family arabinose efflux permease